MERELAASGIKYPPVLGYAPRTHQLIISEAKWVQIFKQDGRNIKSHNIGNYDFNFSQLIAASVKHETLKKKDGLYGLGNEGPMT